MRTSDKKNKAFIRRLQFAINGIVSTFKQESSFRTQLFFGVSALILVGLLGAPPHWWALFILMIGAILACELINTALESLSDRIEPTHNELIGRAKDCAAGAVLILSTTSIILFLIFLWTK